MAGRNSTFHYRAIVISLFIGFNLLPTQCSINTYPKLDIYCEIGSLLTAFNTNMYCRWENDQSPTITPDQTIYYYRLYHVGKTKVKE
jgi:hypothetical protein